MDDCVSSAEYSYRGRASREAPGVILKQRKLDASLYVAATSHTDAENTRPYQLLGHPVSFGGYPSLSCSSKSREDSEIGA
jgi:hypothetical protein